MKIFNRKNKEQEEINELKNSIEILTEAIREKDKDTQEKLQDIQQENKELTIKLTKLEQITEQLTTENEDFCDLFKKLNELMHLKEKYEELLQTNAELTEKQKELTKELKTFKIEQLKKEVQEYPKGEITSKRLSEEVVEKIKQAIEDTNTGKKHLYTVPPSNETPYKDLKLNGTILYNKYKKLSFDILQVINIKNNLQQYYKKGISIRKIGTLNNISNNNTPYRLIWNIEEGTFDELIKQYQNQGEYTPKKDNIFELTNQKENDEDTNHIRKIPPSLKKKYDKVVVNQDGSMTSNGHTLKYNIKDIINLKEKIPKTTEYPSNKKLTETLPQVSEPTALTVIWNIEEGVFDPIIEQYMNKEEETKPSSEKYHIFKMGKSYQYALENIKVNDEGNLYTQRNQKLPYNIYDIIELKKRVYSGKYNLSNIYEDFGYNQQLGNRIIWNIEEGNFNKVIEEFQSRNYTYEVKYNTLYIDGENTHLTIEKCKVIVDCIVNDPNKRDVINRLIKTYPQTDSKYIRIIGEEYNNINFIKILNKQKIKVVKPTVDNPQKRKEQGYV